MSNSRKYDIPMLYRIKVSGRLEPKWSSWFDDCQITPLENGETVLVSKIADQSALHGLLARIGNLGLPILAVICEEQVEPTLSSDKRSTYHEN